MVHEALREVKTLRDRAVLELLVGTLVHELSHDATHDLVIARDEGVREGVEAERVQMDPGAPASEGPGHLDEGLLVRLDCGLAERPLKALVTGRAAMVCMEEYVRPALRKMMGHARLLRPEVTGLFEGEFRKSAPDGKVHLIRVRARRVEGRLVVAPSGPQGSGILSSMLRANALALVPADALALRSGDEVQVHLVEEPEDR